MPWFNSLTETATATYNAMLNGAKWIRKDEYLENLADTSLKFTINTASRALEHIPALPKALASLGQNEEARKIANGFTYVFVHDVVPILALNALNNFAQSYFLKGYDEENATAAYSLVIGVLALGNYAVAAYSLGRGVEASIRVTVLDAFAPSAFNSNKKNTLPCLCNDCKVPTRIKSSLRESGVYWANQGLIAGIYYIPYVGGPASNLLTLVNNGRYIAGVVTPERCEKHKYQELEFVVALGLVYGLSLNFMNRTLESSLGPLPFLHTRVLQHILMAFFINLAAQMTVPLVEPKKATLAGLNLPDVFFYYDNTWRNVLNIFGVGLLKSIKPDLAKQIIHGLNALGQSADKGSKFIKKLETNALIKQSKDSLLPSMFTSTYDFTQDPVLSVYWPSFCKGWVDVCKGIQSYRKNPYAPVITTMSKPVSRLVEHQYEVPKEVSELLLEMSKNRGFWDLIRKMEQFFGQYVTPVPVLELSASSLSHSGVYSAVSVEGLTAPLSQSADRALDISQVFQPAQNRQPEAIDPLPLLELATGTLSHSEIYSAVSVDGLTAPLSQAADRSLDISQVFQPVPKGGVSSRVASNPNGLFSSQKKNRQSEASDPLNALTLSNSSKPTNKGPKIRKDDDLLAFWASLPPAPSGSLTERKAMPEERVAYI